MGERAKFTGFLRRWARPWCAALVLVLWCPAFLARADDVAILRESMNQVYAKNWEAARQAAARADDPLIGEMIEWHVLRAGQGFYGEYVEFLDENSDWPGLDWLQERGEYFIPENAAPEAVLEYLAHRGAQSGEGLYRELKAMRDLGQSEAAGARFVEAAGEMEISAKALDKIGSLGLPQFAKGRFTQINRKIYERDYGDIGEIKGALSENEIRVIEARLKVLRQETSEAEVAHGGVSYDLMRRLKADDNYDEAAALMEASSSSRAALDQPEYWAKHRLDLARNQIWKGNADLAYTLAANHFLEADEDYYAELEFYAGFVALEFLQDATLAREHFNRFKAAVKTPISMGRAGYWLGRAGDPTGYGFGAKYQTSFYGQLSAEKLGGLYDEALLANADGRDYVRREFLQSDSVRAALYYLAMGDALLARRFMAHEAEELSPEDAESLGLMALDLKLPATAVHIGKNQANLGETLGLPYYPMPDFLRQNTLVPDALALAIMRQESEFYPEAESHVGARGLMQLMPATAKEVSDALEINYSLDGLKSDPNYNVQLGTKYLRDLLRDFDGKLPVAILSYNAGPGRGRSWQEHLGEFGRSGEDEAVRWIEMIPFDETRNYVQRVLEGVFIYQAKQQGGFENLSPEKLLLQSYPEGVDWAWVRAEDERIAEEKRLAAEAAQAEAESAPKAEPEESVN